MPFYDYIYGTIDKSTDTLYETSLKREGEPPDVVHLIHLTKPESIFHLRLGSASWASKPLSTTPQWYKKLMWPLASWSTMVTWFCHRTFVTERNFFKTLKLQTWVIPRYIDHVCFFPLFKLMFGTHYLLKVNFLNRHAYFSTLHPSNES